jgi:integrase/recombinase XerD
VRIHEVGKRRPPKLDPRSFDSVLSEYLLALRAAGFSESLHKQARLQLPRFFAHLRQRRVRSVTAVSEADVFDYARELATRARPGTGEPYSCASQTSYLMHVKRLFRFLERTRVILRDPCVDLVLPTWSKLPRAVPTQAQAERLVSVPAPSTVVGRRDRAVLELLYGSGIRVGECERLELRDLDLARGTVFVRTGKGRKDRVVPIAGRAALAMESYLRHSRPKLVKDPREQAVFLNAYGERLSRKTIQAMLRAQVKAAGIQVPLTAHSLRHGCATHMLQRGADVRHVQQLLGHSRIETTALYTRVIPGDVARMIDEKHPRQKSYNRWRKRRRARRPRGDR